MTILMKVLVDVLEGGEGPHFFGRRMWGPTVTIEFFCILLVIQKYKSNRSTMNTLEEKLEALFLSQAASGDEGLPALEFGDAQAGEDEEEVIEVSEQEILKHLDAMNPPLDVCGRLFFPDGPTSTPTLLTATAMASLQSCGYVIIDDLLPPGAANALYTDATRLHAEGLFSAPPMHEGFTDFSSRSDEIMWVHPHSDSAATTPGVHAAAQFLLTIRDDIGSFLALRRGQVGRYSVSISGRMTAAPQCP